ncbi:MAG: hypothetical protein DRH89_05765 [Candidatus Cloacimonadota bacterium]|nr:MAG: hypothetical protein DRH89_05765 [Candidatus Cloacimonadota bacterium]
MFLKVAVKILLLAALCFILSSCLNTEFKQYSFKINADGSGTGTIKFINIVSEEDEEQNVSTTDFDTLINNYINGTTFEEANPNFNVISKELFVENGVLNGQVEFTFKDFQDIGFYHYQRSEHAPIMFYLGALSEIFLETDGEYIGGDEESEIPMIVWTPGTTEFTFKTAVKDEMSNANSLLDLYNLWIEVNK